MDTMHPMLYLFAAVIIIGFAADLILGLLNARHRSRPVPEPLRDVYPPDRYQLQQRYGAESAQLAALEKSLGVTLLLGMLALGGFGALHQWLAGLGLSLSPVLLSLAYLGVLALAAQLAALPFALWDTFVIEQKYGFNRTTPKVFAVDAVKSLLIALTIGGGLLAIVVWLFYTAGAWFWIIALGVMILFTLLANTLYSRVIVPLFNRQEPLAQGPLLDAIHSFGQRVGFPVGKVFVIDGSKRSAKANAYFTGFGRNRRVVLYDTLLQSMTPDQVLAVLAHEVGHYRRGHIWVNMGLSILGSGLLLYLFGAVAGNPHFAAALGVESAQPVFHLSLIGFGLLLGPAQRLLGLATNYLSRAMEYQADAFAQEHGLGEPLAQGLKTLASHNLSNLTPHPAYVWAHYSHPPLHSRLQRLGEVARLGDARRQG